MKRRTIQKKCPNCNGKTYPTNKLTRKCEECGYFYTGIAMTYYEALGNGFNIHLHEV